MSDRAPNPRTMSPGSPGSPGSGTGATDPDPGSRAGEAIVVVRIPGPLRSLTGGAGQVSVPGATVAAVLERLVIEHPGLRRHLLTDTGDVRDYVNLFVNEDDVRYLSGVATELGPEDTVTIVPSIAGG